MLQRPLFRFATMDCEFNKEMDKLKLELYKRQQEILSLEQSICKVKVLQMKAQSIINNTKKINENDKFELEAIDKKFEQFFGLKKDSPIKDVEDTREVDELRKQADELRKQADELKRKLSEVKAIKRELASKIYKNKIEIANQEVRL